MSALLYISFHQLAVIYIEDSHCSELQTWQVFDLDVFIEKYHVYQVICNKGYLSYWLYYSTPTRRLPAWQLPNTHIQNINIDERNAMRILTKWDTPDILQCSSSSWVSFSSSGRKVFSGDRFVMIWCPRSAPGRRGTGNHGRGEHRRIVTFGWYIFLFRGGVCRWN